MQYAIELFYDNETENELYKIMNLVADKGISTKFVEWGTRPHLALGCFNDIEEEVCIERLKQFAQTHKAMPAYLGAVGMFNDTKNIFVTPIMNRDMYQFQRELHEMLCDFNTKGYEWYLPDRWVPHTTLASTGEDSEEAFFKASELVLREFQKIRGEFSSIGLVKVTFPVEEIFAVELKRPL